MESSISKKETVILQEEVTSKKDGFEFSDDDLQSENSVCYDFNLSEDDWKPSKNEDSSSSCSSLHCKTKVNFFC